MPATVLQAASLLVGDKWTHHPLQSPNSVIYSMESKAEIFPDSMEEQLTVHQGIQDTSHTANVEEFLHGYLPGPTSDIPMSFDRVDIRRASHRRLRPKKAPGENRIGATALQRAPPHLLAFVHLLFDSCFRLHHFSNLWKRGQDNIDPKPRKMPTVPNKFRPMSLLPVISNVFQRFLHARITTLLDTIIRYEQFGFLREQSTTFQLTRVRTQLVDATNKSNSSVAVL